MAKDKITSLADELETVMEAIELGKAQLKPLEEREDQIRAELCQALLKKGIEFVRTSSGLSFGMVKGRVTYAIKKGQEQQGIEWAVQNYPAVLSISAAKLNKVVQPMLELPDFIERKEGEPHLAVRTTEEA